MARDLFRNQDGMRGARAFANQPAFDPIRQPDEIQLAELRHAIANNSVPLAEVIRLLQSRNAPAQLRNTPRTYTDVAGFTPSILIEANPNRLGWVLANCNQAANLYFSYGYPIVSTLALLGIQYLGIQIAPAGIYQESNGTISMDDIYVWSDTAGGTALGYEGVLAIESKTN
jgi:hypothetical protein